MIETHFFFMFSESFEPVSSLRVVWARRIQTFSIFSACNSSLFSCVWFSKIKFSVCECWEFNFNPTNGMTANLHDSYKCGKRNTLTDKKKYPSNLKLKVFLLCFDFIVIVSYSVTSNGFKRELKSHSVDGSVIRLNESVKESEWIIWLNKFKWHDSLKRNHRHGHTHTLS